MINNSNEYITFLKEFQTTVAVIFGMLLQFSLGDRQNLRIFLTVAGSSVFVALFIIPAVIDFFKISESGSFANALYALSALVSVELIALVLKILPKIVRAKAYDYLGVKDDNKK